MVDIKDQSLLNLFSRIYKEKGVDFTQYKDGTVLRRINSRMRACNVSNYKQYYQFVEQNPDEVDILLKALTVNVTEFFRNPEMFDALEKQVIPLLVLSKLEKKHKIIRAWSCGCASGDEPYSLAISLLEALGDARHNIIISIFGTDINEKVLNEAKEMIYSKSRLQALDDKLVNKYFDNIGDDKFKIKNFVSSLIKFRNHDVITEKPFINCDIILCRNLLIYFNRELQEETLLKFYECLNPGGFLILGMMETLSGSAAKHFKAFDNRLRIYRRDDDLAVAQKSKEMLSQTDIDKIVGELLNK